MDVRALIAGIGGITCVIGAVVLYALNHPADAAVVFNGFTASLGYLKGLYSQPFDALEEAAE